MDMNVTTLSGRLTKDAEMSSFETANGELSISKFTLACNYRKEKSTFIRCSLFGRLADALNEYLVKGKYVVVSGQLQIQTKEEDDQYKVYVELIVNNISLGPKQAGESEESE